MTLSERLSQPYPLGTFREGVSRNIFFSAFLTVFLLIFRPFGLEVYSYEVSYLIAGYGVVTFFTILLADYVAAHFFSNVFNEEKWTVYKQILYTVAVLCLLGITNYLYAYWIDAFPGTIKGFLKVQLYVFLSCIVPIILVMLWRQNHLLKRNIAEAGRLSSELTVRNDDVPTAETCVTQERVTFYSENNNDSVSILPEELICISSRENYVEIIWHVEQTIRKSLLRSTLTRAEESLADVTDIFRTHRSHIINLRKVTSIDGNAQVYRLHLNGLSETIPVARGRTAALQALLKKEDQ